MDLWIIGGTVVDFLMLLVPLAIISFVLYKIFSPIRKSFAERFDFSWFKSSAILNYIAVFVVLLAIYFIFVLIGYFAAPIRDPELEFDLVQNASMVA